MMPRPLYVGLDFRKDDAVVSALGRRSFVGNLLNFTDGGTVIGELDIMLVDTRVSVDVILLDNEISSGVKVVLFKLFCSSWRVILYETK